MDISWLISQESSSLHGVNAFVCGPVNIVLLLFFGSLDWYGWPCPSL